MPYTHPLPDSPDVTYHVRALASIYTQKVGSNITQTYLNKHKGITKLSGKDFEEMIKEIMYQIEESIKSAGSSEHATSTQHLRVVKQAAEPSQHDIPSQWLVDDPPPIELGLSNVNQKTTASSFNSKTPKTLSPSQLNPPEEIRIVVEHIMRSEDKPLHTHPTLRLKAFSGKITVLQGLLGQCPAC